MSNFLARQWWNAERFGLTPNKLPLRMLNTGMPRIFCITIPKAGTHLLERALCKHPRLYRQLRKTVDEHNLSARGLEHIISRLRPGQLIFSHLFYTEERERLLREADVRCMFMIRDLRDIILSEANYLTSNKSHIYHDAFSGMESQHERILRSLEGCESVGLPSMAQLFDGFHGWMQSCAHVIRFEDLIGQQGGGDDERQQQTLSDMFAFLDIPCDSQQSQKLASCIYSRASPTFHCGSAMQWPRFFDAETKKRFKELTGSAIVDYGYETSNAW